MPDKAVLMMTIMGIEHAMVEKLRVLPAEKQQELLDFADFLIQKTATPPAEQVKKPRISSRGLFADLGITFTEEDLAEARREMWGNFPRDIEL